jgi:pyridoxamine 5'-phosphate oxidase
MNDEIAGIRKDYSLKTLNENEVAENPVQQFSFWWNEAMKSEIPEVNAMTLATASKDGIPHARIVLLKSFDAAGFVFFTNYESNKGNELDNNAKAALVFFWKELERQVRIEGTVKKIAAEESDAYFNSRPAGSRIGAWASPQSNVIAGRDILEENVKRFTEEFEGSIPRPQNWGGYVVIPVSIEFWQGRINRLHDRILYTKTTNDIWKIERLAP